MKRFAAFFAFFLALAPVYGQESASDVPVVQTIISKCSLGSLNIDSVAKFVDGKAVSLKLDNRDFGKKGIKVLPDEVFTLTHLKMLTANDNGIVSLPEKIGNLVNLRVLQFQNNAIERLPESMSELKNLKELDLRNNAMSVFPQVILELSSLEKLQFWGNKITSLPSAISKLTNLKELYLRNNRLTSLPASLMNMNLNYLGIHDNKLCDLPSNIDAWLKGYNKRYRAYQYCKNPTGG